MFGNFISDFLRGKEVDVYDAEITLGIQLHRTIDAYTDSHPQVAQSKERLWKKYRHYSAVIVDIFYDHFLAKNWALYAELPLADFAQKAYDDLSTFEHIFPDKVQRIFPYMVRQNWLLNYGEIDGMRQAMQGIARRASFKSNMEHAVEDLLEQYDAFDRDFQAFFPDLAQHAQDFLNNNS